MHPISPLIYAGLLTPFMDQHHIRTDDERDHCRSPRYIASTIILANAWVTSAHAPILRPLQPVLTLISQPNLLPVFPLRYRDGHPDEIMACAIVMKFSHVAVTERTSRKILNVRRCKALLSADGKWGSSQD
jgi:hypothetical protein